MFTDFIKKQKGFTLIELLVVIAIIGILSSVVLASLSGARESANVTRTASDLQQIETALTMWMQNTGRTQWPHPDNDLGGIGQLANGNYVPIETLVDQTNLDKYLTSVPEPPFGGQYWYHNDVDDPHNGCGSHQGTDINIRNSDITTSIAKKIDGVIDPEIDLNCGKARKVSGNGIYYSLSLDNSF